MMSQDADELRRRLEKYDDDRKGFIIHMAIFAIINVLLWGIWAFFPVIRYGTAPTWPWPMLLTLTWGSGVAAHALDFRSHAPQHLARIDSRVAEQMDAIYGPDWQSVASDDDYQRIQKAVHKSARQRTEFGMHFLIYVMINTLAWVIWAALLGIYGFPIPLLLTGLWGIGIAAHGVSNYFDSSQRVIARERTVQQMTSAVKKKKRLERLMLTDDGELLEVIDEQGEEQQNAQLLT